MTHQEAFDKVWRHFVVKGCPPSMKKTKHESASSCRYRGANRTRCGIGVLIPDREYNAQMEGLSAAELVEKFPIESLRGLDTGFMGAIQESHDDSALLRDDDRSSFSNLIERRLRDVADEWDLTIPEVK